VTHDQTEAMTMSDRIAVFSHGVLQQVATPLAVHHEPANLFVARFVGSPPISVVAAQILPDAIVAFGDRLPLPLGPTLPSGPVWLGLRPEDVSLGEGGLPMTVDLVEHLGSSAIVHLTRENAEVTALLPVAPLPARGTTVPVRLDPTRFYLFDQTNEAALRTPGLAHATEGVRA
jgi:sn-glycerol 3-phosphate transport system ATP-binding protein